MQETTMSMNDPATRQDIADLETKLKQWFLEREIASIRWFVGTQITYFAMTLGAVYFLLKH
jgi:hypothetical protein